MKKNYMDLSAMVKDMLNNFNFALQHASISIDHD